MESKKEKGWIINWYAAYVESIENFCMLGKAGEMWRLGAELAKVRPGDKVLDIGCGTGPLARAVKAICPASEVTGVEPSRKALDIARRRAEEEGLRIEYTPGFIEKIPYPDNFFDVAVSCMVLHHLPPELKVTGLKEVLRVLKPGGHIMMIDVGPANKSIFSKFISFIYQWDIFEWMRDGIKGRLPSIMEKAGFHGAKELTSRFTSMSYFWAKKQEGK